MKLNLQNKAVKIQRWFKFQFATFLLHKLPSSTLRLTPLLKYFLFKGTPKADSPLPAVQVLEFEDPTKFATWRILAIDDVATEIVEKIVISLRSKAMPKTYKHINATSERDMSIKKWTEFMQDSYKGTLHVRG